MGLPDTKPEGSKHPARMTAPALGLLALLLVAGAWLRLEGTGRPVWIDEALTLSWAERDYSEILRSTTTPVMPLTARTVSGLFASDAMAGEMLVRLPAVFFGVLTIAVLYVYLLKRAGLAAAFAAALFLALSPRHIMFSQEARYYALQMLLSLLVFILLERRASRFGLRDTLALGLLMAAGMANHLSFSFFMMAAMAAAGLAVLFDRSGTVAGRAVRVFLMGAAVLVAVSPVLFSMFAVSDSAAAQKVSSLYAEEGAEDNASAEGNGPVRTAYRLGLSQYALDFVGGHFLQPESVPQAVLFTLMAAAGLFVAWRTGKTFFLLLVFALFALPVPLFFKSVYHPWFARYFTTQFPLYAMVVGLGAVAVREAFDCAGVKDGKARAATLLAPLLLFAVVMVPARVRQYPDRFMTYDDVGGKDIAKYLAAEAQPGDGVVLSPRRSGWYPREIINYYLPRYLVNRSEMTASLQCQQLMRSEDLARFLGNQKSGSMWVVTPDREGEETDYLRQNGADRVFAARGSAVWVFGRAAVNMLAGGDFEESPPECIPPDCAEIISGAEAWNGGGSLKVVAPDPPPRSSRMMPTVWLPVVRAGNDGAPSAELGAGCVYVLSFRLRHKDIAPGENPSRVMRVILSAENVWQDLLSIQGTGEWQRYELLLEPGKNVPEGMRNVKIGFGNRGGTGTFWLDEVQLEVGAMPSPFVLDVRPARH